MVRPGSGNSLCQQSPADLPHYSASPLIYIGAITTISRMIPLFKVGSHGQKAIDLYNGMN